MYPFILIHELGHALCISKISTLHNINHKPVIVIGNYAKCLNRKPNHKIFGFDVYHYDSYFCKNGTTLYPYFDNFSDNEIIKCARAGYRMELLSALIFAFISIIFVYLFIVAKNYLLILTGLFFYFLFVIELLLGFYTILKSTDKLIWTNKKPFDIKSIKEQYYKLNSLNSVYK